MALLPSASELLARQVRLIVSPPTSTLFESRAILSGMQSRFGAVAAFTNERNDDVLRGVLREGSSGGAGTTTTTTTTTRTTATTPTGSSMGRVQSQTMLALFESAASKKSAMDARLITVCCGGDLEPSAKELDPFNARDLHGRHYPPKRTFSCRIVEEQDSTILRRLAEDHPYSGSFDDDPLQISYGDLVRSRVSVRGMADIMQTRKPAPEKVPKQHDRDEGLMAAWRRGIERKKGGQELTANSHQDSDNHK